MDKKAILIDYIKNEIIRNRNAQLDEREDLLAAGILDSLGVLRLVAFMDSTFGIEIPDADVVYENFNSVNAMAAYLDQFS